MKAIGEDAMEKPPEIQKAILDYASPTKLTPMRLASTSIITVMPSADGFDVVERLRGKVSALVAIIFCGFSVTLMDSIVVNIMDIRRIIHTGEWTFFLLPLPITIGAVWGTLNLIASTWRRTILEIRPGNLTLIFGDPFKSQKYDWTNEQIRQVRVTVDDQHALYLLCELQIETWRDPLVKLFTGHSREEIAGIAQKIELLCVQSNG